MKDKTTKSESISDDNIKLSTESYKGVRDFYPDDMRVMNYLFGTMRKALESFGYEEYNASPLEPTELYTSKSGEEIVNEQTYSFKDRGDRDVTLRPEMTPTVARMIAGKKREISFPARWFSIPNVFRYEKPQRGRIREHYQLNVDLFGEPSINAEIEILLSIDAIMKAFGAKNSDFTIKLSSRKILNSLMTNILGLNSELSHQLTKLLDRKNKMTGAEFISQADSIIGDKNKSETFIKFTTIKNIDDLDSKIAGKDEVSEVIKKTSNLGLKNIEFDPTITRGFDYYTGIVFEVFDTDPKNPRALMGGGRYDDLLSLFSNEKVTAVGYGAGDVTLQDFLEIRDLLPKSKKEKSIYIAHASTEDLEFAMQISAKLRENKINVTTDISSKKIQDQLKKANKDGADFTIVIGEKEKSSGIFPLKNMQTGEIKELGLEKIISEINSL